MKKELPKAYEPTQYEDDIYKRWEESGFFAPSDDGGQTFSMVLPPPNVTGTLHMGHAVMLAVQDLMTRYHRMQGDRTLWIPGTDHAAIATESKVEKLLIEDEGMSKPKETLGRDAFLDRVHQFAAESHDTIVNQAKKMGSSMDWSREAFTLDATREKAVRSVFKIMYDDGLIYRGFRTVNWSTAGQSTCSDDEVEHITRQSKLYTFKYSDDCPITIATTRPETKLGDTAIAVHPEGRWKQYIGQTFTVENFANSGNTLTLKVFGDEGVEDDFGTGALGVTTAHSHIDFEMYTKQKALGNDIGMIQVIGEDGNMTAEAGSKYAGMTVEEARSAVVDQLRTDGLMIDEEEIEQNIGISDRFKDIIEVLPKMQWFIDVNKPFAFKGDALGPYTKGDMVTLKQLMQESVRGGHINMVPERFEKTYFHWVDNLRDWCISRQIWYGHQVPVKYDIRSTNNIDGMIVLKDRFFKMDKNIWDNYSGTGGGSVVGDTIEPVHLSFLKAHELIKDGHITWEELNQNILSAQTGRCKDFSIIEDGESLGEFEIQDPDTLDTWFSSGLWTFSTLAHSPEDIRIEDGKLMIDTDDFRDFHPTSVLETGYDILPFWVARMILMTTYAVGDIPFETVYLHGLVRDEQGRKMSKSLGNILDPLDMTPKYGTDATRLSLLIGATPGNDTKLSEEKVEGFRNFTNKLWNMSRFSLMTIPNIETFTSLKQIEQINPITTADKWILDRLQMVIKETTNKIEKYQFSSAGENLRDFTWITLANWYLEVSKKQDNSSGVLLYVLTTVLRLWHPFMPFVTGQVWKEMFGESFGLLLQADWPKAQERLVNTTAVRNFELIREVTSMITVLRENQNINAAKKLDVVLCTTTYSGLLEEHVEFILMKSNLNSCSVVATFEPNDGYVTAKVDGIDIYLNVVGAIDVEAERERIQKELDHVAPYITQLEAKLSGPFAKNAPAAVVEGERAKLAEAKEKCATLEGQLTQLG